MPKFIKIDSKVVAADAKLAGYLRRASIAPAKKGGAFVGNYEVAPDELRKYGIVLPKGGMIIPDSESDELRGIMQEVREAEAVECLRWKEKTEAVHQAAEQKITEARDRLLPAVQAAYDLLRTNNGPCWRLQALQYGEDEPSLFGRAEQSKFETSHKIGLIELPPVTDATFVFEWTAEDVARLTRIVTQWIESIQPRRDFLWKLFVESNGIFTKSEVAESCFAGHSLVTGGAKYDEWIESTYYIGGEKVTDAEHEWLRGRSGELSVPEGYVRVANDTNDLLRIPPIPGRNDVLVVVGKTGSRRGEWSYGEWFRGHPSECQICFWHKGTQRQIRTVTLNGRVQESNWVNLDLWKDPRELAKRALQEAGIEPSEERVKAMAEAYRR